MAVATRKTKTFAFNSGWPIDEGLTETVVHEVAESAIPHPDDLDRYADIIQPQLDEAGKMAFLHYQDLAGLRRMAMVDIAALGTHKEGCAHCARSSPNRVFAGHATVYRKELRSTRMHSSAELLVLISTCHMSGSPH